MIFDTRVKPVVYEGGTSVFIDTEYDTWNMDPVALEKAFEFYPGVRVVVVAHFYGTQSKKDKNRATRDQHGMVIVEKAAEFFDATYKGKQTGTVGDIGVISLIGVKNITDNLYRKIV